MPDLGVGEAILGSSILSAGTSLFSGSNSSEAATGAAQVQNLAAIQASQQQLAQFQQTREDLSPYRDAGATGLEFLKTLTGFQDGGDVYNSALASLIDTSLPGAPGPFQQKAVNPGPWSPTQQQLEQTPGYQFTRDQGLKATQNSFAAQGLASSGAALKGAANYAEGLASTTYGQNFDIYNKGYQNFLNTNAQDFSFYQNQFNNYLSTNQQLLASRAQQIGQKQQVYNMVSGLTNSGLNAASLTGQIGLTATRDANNFLTSGAAAQAGGIVGSANALTGALSGVSGAANNGALFSALNNNGLFGGGNSSVPGSNVPVGGIDFFSALG